ncbi:FAD-dependent oxidoreductase [uncultured Dokdonia sp.]|mgnify:CR=1 FL=1|uniref:NAD(P)/FAD-dependent oxidoreductase n=1 Tax=uncultured Dokdonia sp. TaxID=575653 RepID=UPI00262D5898|nr:FAD-dependent oxidoreductase [uncultured Dokdonia sp.]
MSLSYWEHQTWLSAIDYTIVGSGIVGLNAALRLREKFPKARILILEKGMLPQGASTKNAGFACFGSLSEILDDLTSHSEEEVVALIKQRINGLKLLRETLGDGTLDYQELGGYELFTDQDEALYEHCLQHIEKINALLHPIFGAPVYSTKENTFGFQQIQKKYIYNAFEGQIDTGKMIDGLLQLALSKGIKIMNGVRVIRFEDQESHVEVITDTFSLQTHQLLIATNGFASQLGFPEVKPARAQVLITKPIPDLKIEGTFHLDKGYYYFRNINNRILFGGGRNLDFKTEETTDLGQTEIVQRELERLLKEVILPNTFFEIDRRWSGIMGVGSQKKPILKSISIRIHAGVRLGGMGVAIGSQVGRDLADLANR